MRRTGLALAVIALAAVAAVPESSARIVPQQGMRSLTIGMTRQAVKSRLGRPARAVRGSNDFGRYTELHYPRGLRVVLQGDRSVTALVAVTRAERTASGVGVGSTVAAVRAGVPGVRCGTDETIRHCHAGSFVPGARVTDFAIRKGRVWRVTLGIVID